jgi:fructokinase
MIVCCGEALVDMVARGEGFLPLPGGSPYNTAVAIGRLGVSVRFLGRFSTDFFGEILVKRLRENNVGDDLIIRSPENSALAFVRTEKDKEPRYVFYTEGTANLSLEAADLPDSLPEDTSCVLFGSIAMTIEPAASSIETLIFREKKAVISFDPNIRPFMIQNKAVYIKRLEKWFAACDIAKVSAADFNYIYPDLDARQAAQKALSLGPSLVICTLGRDGALALLRRSDGNIIKTAAPAVDLPVTDTIGAGDTFHGAFLSWLEIKGKMSRPALLNLSEKELYNALFFANKAASIVCARRGADPPFLREVEELKVRRASA